MNAPIILHLTDAGKAEFGHIFPDGVPLKSPFAVIAPLKGHGLAWVYEVNWARVDAAQKKRVVAQMRTKFGSRSQDIMKRLDDDGYFPIRVEWCQVVSSEVPLAL